MFRLPVGVLLALLLLAAPAQANITSRFDAGAEGWTAAESKATYQAAGGNPGGYVASPLRGPDGLLAEFLAPNDGRWNRDQRQAVGKLLSFDLLLPGRGTEEVEPLVELARGDGHVLTLRRVVGGSSSWQHFDARLAPGGGWFARDGGGPERAATAGDFEQVLADLGTIGIYSGGVDGTGSAGLDNVVLQVPTADVATTIEAPKEAMDNRPVTVRVTVHNEGPDAAAGTTVAVDLPSQVAAIKASPSQGACAVTGNHHDDVMCEAGEVTTGKPLSVDVTFTSHAGDQPNSHFEARAVTAAYDGVAKNDAVTTRFHSLDAHGGGLALLNSKVQFYRGAPRPIMACTLPVRCKGTLRLIAGKLRRTVRYSVPSHKSKFVAVAVSSAQRDYVRAHLPLGGRIEVDPDIAGGLLLKRKVTVVEPS